MNELAENFGENLNIIAFPCNQFGHQTNESDAEFLNVLKHIRPGNGFEPKADIFGKVNVNGSKAHPVLKWLKSSIRAPQDPWVTPREMDATIVMC
eukprot:UN25656